MSITKSKAWVEFDRDRKHRIPIREWQKDAWKQLFGHFNFDEKSITHELNTKFMPEGTHLVAFNAERPEEFLLRTQELLEGTDYEIKILIKPKNPKSNHENY